MTQAELAKAINVQQKDVAAYEAGRAMPTGAVVAKMAKALGYIDYYDYKVTQAEGFGKVALFEILDTLETGTRPLMARRTRSRE